MRGSAICCELLITILETPEDGLAELHTPQPHCFKTAFPGSPNGFSSRPLRKTFARSSDLCIVQVACIYVTRRQETGPGTALLNIFELNLVRVSAVNRPTTTASYRQYENSHGGLRRRSSILNIWGFYAQQSFFLGGTHEFYGHRHGERYRKWRLPALCTPGPAVAAHGLHHGRNPDRIFEHNACVRDAGERALRAAADQRRRSQG